MLHPERGRHVSHQPIQPLRFHEVSQSPDQHLVVFHRRHAPLFGRRPESLNVLKADSGGKLIGRPPSGNIEARVRYEEGHASSKQTKRPTTRRGAGGYPSYRSKQQRMIRNQQIHGLFDQGIHDLFGYFVADTERSDLCLSIAELKTGYVPGGGTRRVNVAMEPFNNVSDRWSRHAPIVVLEPYAERLPSEPWTGQRNSRGPTTPTPTDFWRRATWRS